MAVQVRIELSYAGIGQIARSDQLRAEMLRRARAVAAAAEELAAPIDPHHLPIEASAVTGRSRARASVMFLGGLHIEHAHRVLGQAIDAARD